MASTPRERMGPPSRSLAADAHGCIMDRILEDTSSTIHRIQGCGAMAPPRAGSTQIVSCAGVCREAVGARIAGVDRRRPLDRRTRKTEQVERRTMWPNHRLTTKAPYKGDPVRRKTRSRPGEGAL